MRINRRAWMTIVLASAAIAAQLTLLWLRGTAFVVSGDEGTFLAMTSSLALDRDLEFGEADRKRLEGSVEGGRRAVILQRFGSRVAYSKPVLFPLLASPWYRLLGEAGVVIFNGVCLLLALVVARAFLLRRWTDGSVGVAVVTFAGTGVLLSYVAWTMSD
ncbi:MAG: hypothetical protein OEM62_13115, partial [Acidobacteriota bacterium]|nr:hypothetical protein [Acidobacteriota bacterium]